MIEFTGYLTGSSLKHLQKSNFKIMCGVVTIAFIICSVFMACIFGLEGWGLVILLLTPVYLIFCVLFPYLFIKFNKKYIPKKITINNDTILCITDEIGADCRKIEQIKEVRDYGEYYVVICKGLNTPPHFICQKDLLSHGSIDEFEAMFAGKIKRMKENFVNVNGKPVSRQITEGLIIMIEFKGKLADNILKILRKRMVSNQQKTNISFFFFSLPMLIFLLHFIMPLKYIFIILLILAILAAFTPYLILKANIIHLVPKCITINDGLIILTTDSLTYSKNIAQVKEVKDYGDYYAFTFVGILTNSSPYICQKDLLTQGTLADFEALFAGKIKRMPKKK